MGYPFYNGSQELEDDERAKLYANWKNGNSPVMICTSAFGTGNDYAHVHLVIHAGTPFEMLDYTQEVSRAGHDKQPALCVMFPTQLHSEKVKGADLCGKQYMQDALAGSPVCIHYLITFFNDGVGFYCIETEDNQQYMQNLRDTVTTTLETFQLDITPFHTILSIIDGLFADSLIWPIAQSYYYLGVIPLLPMPPGGLPHITSTQQQQLHQNLTHEFHLSAIHLADPLKPLYYLVISPISSPPPLIFRSLILNL
ncbi:hypothetical protein CPB84DRAFT_1855202 [Gymnopilus junonius]|uniref:DNA 3'-5' helicase n=1 Tax=Gymnopilus junonius TaxID=109634 RepID=A0A9P5TFV2_GYMJU|nr:hypothetical protein CPB84DRAFT_1855202 [Gymnopilus junonius]